MTTVVFISAPSHDPQSWRRVADYLPPAWAVAAPALDECATMAEVVTTIDADALAVSREPFVVVTQGRGVHAALALCEMKPERVAGMFISAPRQGSGLAEAGRRMVGRHIPYEAAIRADGKRSFPTSIPYTIAHPQRAGKAPNTTNVYIVAEASSDWYDYAPEAFAAHVRHFVASLAATEVLGEATDERGD